MNDGFQGCIQFLKINDKSFNLSFPSQDIKNGVNIGNIFILSTRVFISEYIINLNLDECSDRKCLNRVCLNGGRCRLTNDFTKKVKAECICQRSYVGKSCEVKQNACLSRPCHASNSSYCVPTSTGSFHCICPDFFDGDYCEKSKISNQHNFTSLIDLNLFLEDVIVKPKYMASFNGKSFIERAPLDYTLNSIDMVFYTKRTDGILLYNGDATSNQFLGIKVLNSYVHFMIYIDNKQEELM